MFVRGESAATVNAFVSTTVSFGASDAIVPMLPMTASVTRTSWSVVSPTFVTAYVYVTVSLGPADVGDAVFTIWMFGWITISVCGSVSQTVVWPVSVPHAVTMLITLLTP